MILIQVATVAAEQHFCQQDLLHTAFSVEAQLPNLFWYHECCERLCDTEL